MAKTTLISPIYSGGYTRGVNRSAAGILSRKKKRKARKAARARSLVAKQRRIAEEYLRAKKRSRR